MPSTRGTNAAAPPLSSSSSRLQSRSKPDSLKSRQEAREPPRRATRQTPIPPPIPPLQVSTPVPPQLSQASPPQHQQTSSQSADGGQPFVKRGRGRPPKHRSAADLIRSQLEADSAASGPNMAAVSVSKEFVRPPDLVAPDITYHSPHNPTQPGRQGSLSKPHGPNAQPARVNGGAPRAAAPAVPSVPGPNPGASKLTPNRPPPRADRNIDKVVFGSLCFRTWYPSYYGKEVLGDTSGNATKGAKEAAAHDSAHGGAAKGHPSKKQDQHHPHMLERLYVCPSCFKYSKELVTWWSHVRICEQQGHVPGRKVYTHPRGRRKVLVPAPDGGRTGASVSGSAKKKGRDGARYVEEIVEDEGEWSIWEVDGEKDGLFCQNLSLFAKLFLDNKSVFFDVTGFKYYLLVYTPPPPKVVPPSEPDQAAAAVPTASVAATAVTSSTSQPPKPQITGFFSKEKMSWDSNNLACILILPPWQRKGLGGMLMGASYEISRREGVMGGPEKPISDLGRKGYRRYWAGEIARWLLGLEAAEEGSEQEVIVDINDCSQATWIAVEDCLATLREMDFVEEAGLGHGKPSLDDEDEEMVDETPIEAKTGQSSTTAPTEAGEGDTKLVNRVRVDKEAVRRYITAHGISLERFCDPDGFIEGYAVKESAEDDEDEDEDME